MSKLSAIIKERGISMYSLCSVIKKSSAGFNGYLKKQVIGELPMNYSDYLAILNYLKLTESDVPFEKVKVRMK
jgi:hypothetical protein